MSLDFIREGPWGLSPADGSMGYNELCDKLYEDISQVLNKERTSLKDVVDKNIEDVGKTDASKEPQTQSTMDDDDMPLNINQLTGFDV